MATFLRPSVSHKNIIHASEFNMKKNPVKLQKIGISIHRFFQKKMYTLGGSQNKRFSVVLTHYVEL